MTDIKPGARLLFLRDEELRLAIELLYFAHRDFTLEADALSAGGEYGPAHHRIIYFVGRNPGISVSELLSLLRVTKQSLSRVLSRLLEDELIAQKVGRNDRRRRHLELTPKGMDLERNLTEKQRARIAAAYREAGPEAVEGFRKVMFGLLDEEDRDRFVRSAGKNQGAPKR